MLVNVFQGHSQQVGNILILHNLHELIQQVTDFSFYHFNTVTKNSSVVSLFFFLLKT